MRRPVRLLVLFALLMLLAAPAAAQTLSPRLEQALTTGDSPWRDSDGALTVWVYFQDKGLSGAALERALAAAESQLNERAAWRRAKVTGPGQPLVDQGDLPVHPDYLDLCRATGAELRRQSRWLNAASFQATAGQVRQLAGLDCVSRVDLVARFRRPELPATAPAEEPAGKSAGDWDIDYGGNLAAMEQFNVPAVHAMGVNGQGVIIGLLDTGFHTTHEALIDIPVLAAYDFLNDDGNVDNEGDDPPTAKNHGTMTMSTAMGYEPGDHVAPAFGASAILAKTEDVASEVPIEEDHWVAGMEWVESQGADIVSSSLGYLDWYEWADMDGQTAVTTIAADLAVARGLVIVNSAGNERGTSWNHIIAPADGFDVITVGAVTSSGDYTYFSSPGPSYDGRIKPDIAALGSNNHVADPNLDTGYTFASGTSFSCPLTSGVAALILSRVPSLTPDQVREALRETASMADAPNNDYGWGLIDALAAVTYFGPNFTHTPLTDTEDTAGPYSMGMTITDRLGLDEATTRVWYRTDGGPWQDVPIWPTGGGPVSYWAEIPGQPDGTIIDYYLEASSVDGGPTTRLPAVAPAEFFSFRTGADITAPEVAHTPLRDQVLSQWPPTVSCRAADNLGVDRAELFFSHNGGPQQGPFAMTATAGGGFELPLPLELGQVAVGDQIAYSLTVWDVAATPNSTVVGPHEFAIIETRGLVLVLEDGGAKTGDVKIDFSVKDKPQMTPETGMSSAASIAQWLQAAGFVADVLPAAGVVVEDFQSYDLVLLSSGNNTLPVEDAATRTALQHWAGQGGKLLIEGGELGYDALSYPGYPEFAAQVLHAVDWSTDNAGDLIVAGGHRDHPLLNAPFYLPNQVSIAYDGYGDEDSVEPAADSYVVMVPLSHQADAGILIHDDNPAPQSAQIVYFAFNIEAIDPVLGPQFIENAVVYLLTPEAPPTAALSGEVTLAGQTDHSGVLIDLGNGLTTTSAADGSWSLSDLYGGPYTIVASKDGWSVDSRQVVLGDGQYLAGIDFTLSPIITTSYQIFPGVTIPDADPGGVLTTITVPESEAGIITSVTVDVYIEHTWPADLTIVLTSPQGTGVVLHNRTGLNTYNILGNWPENLTVDGPGSLDDFIGENNAGVWTMFASDAVSADEGQITMWGLNFELPQVVSAAPEDGLPRVTRLLGNVPNPFNPVTDISFDLARGGRTSLEIFDLKGRRVARLVDETLSAGRHTYRWDGRDGRGHAVSSGTYLYRLRQGEVTHDRKMLLVR
jgi:serine protease AprX